jgi:flavin-dependent dehydrogenase
MSSDFDLAVVGGGPAGLAAALCARAKGFSVVVLERNPGPIDKACGEGLMPRGLAALERMGVWPRIPAAECARFDCIRYLQEDGRFVDGPLPAPGGLGIRRLALSQAMAEAARAAGVELRAGTALREHALEADGVALSTDLGQLRAGLLVAADGLHSPLRKAHRLERPAEGPARFGLRRHFARAPWAPRVEVHFADGVEAYVTPAGAQRVGVAFLWEDGRVDGRIAFDALLARFPLLEAQLQGARFDSEPRGAGPLLQVVHARVKDRLVLLGDAAGYVDAITGEGLSLAFDAAAALAENLLAARAAGYRADSLAPYSLAVERAFGHYARLAGGLVALARRPALRRFTLDRLIAHPWIFERALKAAASP